MKEPRHFTITVVTLTVMFAALCIGAQVKQLASGSVIPDFKLKDQAGKEVTPDLYKDKLIVLDVCSIQCPYSLATDLDLAPLAAAYASKGVVFLAVESNMKTTPADIQKYVAEKKIPYPILKEGDNKYVDTLGATRTPEFYVFDKNHKLVYHGAFDDRKVPDKKGATNYIKNALDDLLAGRPVKTPDVPAWGCTITRIK